MTAPAPDRLEPTACPLCGASAVHDSPIYAFPELPYRAVCCRECGLWYLNPRLREAEMLKLYADDSYFGRDDQQGYSSYGAQKDSLTLTFARFLRRLHETRRTGGRLLEVGCGYGYLLAEASPYFDQRWGTDYSPAAVAAAAAVADRALLGGIDDVPAHEVFDTVIAVGVIEHIYQPLPFVQKLAARLRPGGSLVLATPDMGSFWRRLMGARWASFKLPEHVTFFDAVTLGTLLQRAGLHTTQTIPFPHAFPLALVGEKLGLPIGGSLGRINLWFPATTVALAATR